MEGKKSEFYSHNVLHYCIPMFSAEKTRYCYLRYQKGNVVLRQNHLSKKKFH